MGALRKIMIAVVILGALAGIQQAGTFASFNATTTNASSTFQTGALALSNLKQGGSTCFSYGASANGFSNGNTNACDALYSFAANQIPNNTVSSVQLTLTAPAANTLTVTNLKLYGATLCASANDGGTIHGNGNLCSSVKMTVQEYTTSGFTTATTTCAFPFNASGACPAATSGGLLNTLSATPQALTGGLNSTGRFFKVNLVFPDSGVAGSENATMGLTSNFALGWSID
jgi:hypothetical protein